MHRKHDSCFLTMKKQNMKQMLLSFCCLLTISICHGQFVTGQKLIGGQLSFGMNDFSMPQGNYVDQKSTTLSLGLSLSRFRSPTVLTGFGISYNYQYSKSFNSGTVNDAFTYHNHTIGATYSGTKLKPLAKDFYFTLTGTVRANYFFNNSKQASTAAEFRSNGYGTGLSGSIGLLYQLNQRFLLNCDFSNLLSLSYSHSKYPTGNTFTTQSFNFSTGLSGFSMNSLAFGVRYLLKQ